MNVFADETVMREHWNMSGWNERTVRIDDVNIVVSEAGSGTPLLILHDELGPAQWQQWHEEVSKTHKLIMPAHPGFRGGRVEWVRNMRDLSCFYARLLREENVGPVDVIGFSFGGWLAAEMSVNNPAQFKRMVLVAPFGIKPTDGYIADMFLMTSAEYLRASFVNPEATAEFATLFAAPTPELIESWEDARLECAKLAWQPYMFEPSLPHLLAGVGNLPALVICGDGDEIVPVSAAQAYASAIPNCRIEVVKDCGHRPEIERRADFVSIATKFFA